MRQKTAFAHTQAALLLTEYLWCGVTPCVLERTPGELTLVPIKRLGRSGFLLRLAAVLLTLVVSVGVLPPASTGLPALVAGRSTVSMAYAASGDLAPMPTPRDTPAAATSGNSIYVFGGRGAETTVEAYDTVTNTWSTKEPMPTGRYSMGAAVGSDGKIYVVGGRSAPTAVEAYSPQTNTWETKPSIPDGGHIDHAVVADAQGQIYAIGGFRTEAVVHRLDPTTGVWTSPTTLPTPRSMLAAAVGPDGAIYTIGGPGPDLLQALGTVERYDPTANTWTTLTPMPTPRQGLGAAFGSNGRLYVFGGFFTMTSPMTLEEYNPSTNSWATRRMTAKGVFGHSFVAVNGRLYAMGGLAWLSSLPSPILFAYDPATDTWLPDPDAPTITSLRINQGASVTNSLQVTLSIQAFDPHGLVSQMAFSNDGGANWSAWEPYATSKPWMLSSGADGLRTVQARVRDAAGSTLQDASGTILLETVAPTVLSLSINGGALVTTSTAVSLSLAATDPASGSGVSHMAFSNDGGGSWSAWEPFAVSKSWTLAGGNGAKTVQAHVRDAAGNVSPSASAQITLDGSLGSNPGLSINSAAVFTNTVDVTLSVIGPAGTAQMQVSNDGGFGGSSWEPFTTRKPWQMTQYGTAIVSRTVYVRFKDVGGSPSAVYQDDIILDVTAPTGSVTVPGTGAAGERSVASPTRNVQLAASDDLSSQSQLQMRLSNRPDFAGAIWKPFASSMTWDFTGGTTVYAQFKDGAGNLSPVYSQSVAGSPSGGTSPAPSCSPRPRINVHTEVAVGAPEAGGAMLVTVSTTGSNNGLRAVRFDSFSNAIVHAGDQIHQTAPFAVSIPPGQEPTSLRFFVQRQTPGQSTTVRLVVVDGCGEWSTLVGGGPNAF